MARRGFLAELAYQNAQAQKRQRQAATAAARQQAAAARQHATAVREYERAVKASERAETQQARAEAAQSKAAEKEARERYVESRVAEAGSLNAELAAQYADIDSILAWTLDFDDYLDLETLRRTVNHPAHPRPDLLEPVPAPAPILAPTEPVFVEPEPVKGIFAKRKNEQASATARAAFDVEHQAWQAEVAKIPGLQFEQMQQHQQAELARATELAQVDEQHRAACEHHEREVAVHNAKLDEFITGLAANDETAVQEYVALVLARSVYPDHFTVVHDYEYSAADRELTLRLTVPTPSELPNVKEHKYNKTKDEITNTTITQKEQKDRYASAVHQVAVRTMHEVFEADRDGRITTIALTVSAEGIDAATGLPAATPLVAVASHRDVFVEFDLANVVPAATLQHLNAVVSKNPFGLVAIDTGPGVRG